MSRSDPDKSSHRDMVVVGLGAWMWVAFESRRWWSHADTRAALILYLVPPLLVAIGAAAVAVARRTTYKHAAVCAGCFALFWGVILALSSSPTSDYP